MKINHELFVHPLGKVEVIQTDRGEKEVINSWAFASIVWSGAVLDVAPKSMSIAIDLFGDLKRFQDLYNRSARGDEAAIREALSVLANAFDDRMEKEFSKRSNI